MQFNGRVKVLKGGKGVRSLLHQCPKLMNVGKAVEVCNQRIEFVCAPSVDYAHLYGIS